jgi:hypothetical protein
MVQKSIQSGKNIFKQIGFVITKTWKKEPPESCLKCDCDSIKGVEILGAYEGALYWECSSCNEAYLRFTKQTTIKYLEKTVNLFIDLEGLDTIWEQLPN